jgi:hypothetical protein
MADEDYQEPIQVSLSNHQTQAVFSLDADRDQEIIAPPTEEDFTRSDPFPTGGRRKKKKPLPAQHVITSTTTSTQPKEVTCCSF